MAMVIGIVSIAIVVEPIAVNGDSKILVYERLSQTKSSLELHKIQAQTWNAIIELCKIF